PARAGKCLTTAPPLTLFSTLLRAAVCWRSAGGGRFSRAPPPAAEAAPRCRPRESGDRPGIGILRHLDRSRSKPPPAVVPAKAGTGRGSASSVTRTASG